MVIYYSRSGSTKKVAETLAKEKRAKIFQLKEKAGKDGLIGGLIKSVFKKESEVSPMPDLTGERTVYICSPVWASGVTPAVRYFINHADLTGKTVKVLFTCMSPSDSYEKEVESLLAEKKLKLEGSLVLTPKKNPDIPLEKLREF